MPDRVMAGARAETRRVAVDEGIELHVEERGRGPSVLVVPSASWLAADLGPLEEDRRVVAYDLRGRGRSSAVLDDARLSFEHDLADFEALRGALGLERFALLGWSYHALVALRYALGHPERVERVLAVGPSSPRYDPWFPAFLERFQERIDRAALQRREAQRAAGLKERDPRAFCRATHAILVAAYAADPACLARMRSDPCAEPNLDADRVNNQGRRIFDKMRAYDWTADFTAFTTPTLVLQGTSDPVPIEGTREWLDALPTARLLTIEGAGHLPWLETPAAFFAPARAFLAGGWPPGARR